MPHSLEAQRFSEDQLPLVRGFRCSTAIWCNLATQFISSDETVRGSALWSINHFGNEVFLYFDETHFVGFGSLGVANWRIPPPNGPRTRLAYIPQIAIATAFQGGPQGAPKEQRYSHQMMRDLIGRALLIPDVDSLTLRVHPRNTGAIRLYESFDFHRLDELDGMVRMIRVLR
jgi:ribosomal protein S18 acetylase RimI-like enzyme